MGLLSGKRIIKFALLACFLGCLGLYVTTGEVFAATAQTAWGGQSDNNQCDWQNNDNQECTNVSTAAITYQTSTCDAWDQNHVCIHYAIHFSGPRPANCDSWDAQNHICNHYNLNFLNTPPANCDSWDAQNQVCTHWQVPNSSNSSSSDDK